MPIFDFENVFFIISSIATICRTYIRSIDCDTSDDGAKELQEWRSHQCTYKQIFNLPSFVRSFNLAVLLSSRLCCVKSIWTEQVFSIQKRIRSMNAALNNSEPGSWLENRLKVRLCTVACIISKIYKIYFDFEHLWNYGGNNNGHITFSIAVWVYVCVCGDEVGDLPNAVDVVDDRNRCSS